MFQLLQLKDEILFNKKKEFKGQEQKELETDNMNSLTKLTPLAGLEKGRNELSLQRSSSQFLSSKGKRVLEPMGMTVSREQRDTIGKAHREHQTFGLYNPKYHLAFEKSQLYLNPAEKKKMEE